MKYLKVKKNFDNYKRNDGSIYVSNELYTEAESKKYGINPSFCTEIEISSKKTYFLFGARFEKKQ
jgi:hypothetical protein